MYGTMIRFIFEVWGYFSIIPYFFPILMVPGVSLYLVRSKMSCVQQKFILTVICFPGALCGCLLLMSGIIYQIRYFNIGLTAMTAIALCVFYPSIPILMLTLLFEVQSIYLYKKSLNERIKGEALIFLIVFSYFLYPVCEYMLDTE